MTTCYLKTSSPEFYQKRTLEPDYDMQIFADSNINVFGQTTIFLKTSVQIRNVNSNVPFMIIPDPSLYNTPIRFSGSPMYINQDGYYTMTLCLTNLSPYPYTITYGKPIAKITLLNTKFNLVIEP
jgi:hypothetical protein